MDALAPGSHRTAWTANDRRQVGELMVRWRHNVPALEWERLARRMGRTAAALRAWVWRNRPPRWRRHPWTEPQLRRIRAQWQIGVAAGWSDRKIARAAASTLRPHSVGSVYMQAYRLDLHGKPRPDDHEESPRAPPKAPPRPPQVHMESRSTVSAAVRTVLPSIEIHRAYISSPARSPNMPGTEPSSSTSTPRQRLQLARPPPGRRPRTPRCPAGSRQPPRTNARPNGAAGRHALRDRHRSALRRRRLHGGRRRRPHPHPRPALRSRPPGHFTRPSGSPRTPARPPRSSSTAPSSTTRRSRRATGSWPPPMSRSAPSRCINASRTATRSTPAAAPPRPNRTKAAVELVQLYEWLVSARALPQADTKETA